MTDSDSSLRLPPDLLDLALDQLVGATAQERQNVVEALATEHPSHAQALRALAERLAMADDMVANSFPSPTSLPPTTIGGYRVERRLGEGAFGVVYACEQLTPVMRRVAIKVLREGVGDQHTLRRFTTERQLLATLNHPTITQIFDAGALPDGRPYFVMEFVDGIPITDYCARHGLHEDARLRLFVDLCQGIGFANRSSVVHRDLKPANVLVVGEPTQPRPMVIDFGVAKAMAPLPREAPAPLTDAGRVIGTPGYMSPEQANGQVELVDQRADVFALGVMLHELLVGRIPKRGDSTTGIGPLPGLKRELGWILRKAMATERDQRYSTADDLAADLERHLAGRPVLAGPPHLGYRLAKFVRRHRVATFSFTMLGLLLIASGAWLLGNTRLAAEDRLTAAEQLRASQAEAAQAVQRLLERANDPSLLRLPRSSAVRRDLARDALALYERWLAERPVDPELRRGRCEALRTLSQVHFLLGASTEALATAERCEAEALSLWMAKPDSVVLRGLLGDARRQHVRSLQLSQRWDEAEPVAELAIADLAACTAASPGDYGQSLSAAWRELGASLETHSKLARASLAYQRSVTVLEDLLARGLPPDPLRGDLVFARLAAVRTYSTSGQLDEADRSLAAVAPELVKGLDEGLRATTVFLLEQARLAVRRDQDSIAVAKYEQALAKGTEWCRQEPLQQAPYYAPRVGFDELAQVHERMENWAAADLAMQQAIEHHQAVIAGFPDQDDHRRELCGALVNFSRRVWNRFRRSDLVLATTWLQQALRLLAELPPRGDFTRPLEWECQSLLAGVSEAQGTAADTAWEKVAETLGTPERQVPTPLIAPFVEAWLGILRSRLRRGQLDMAVAALRQIAPLLGSVDDDYRSQAAYAQARLAIARHDLGAAADAMARILAERPSWWGHWRVGDCERALWQSADPATAEAIEHRDAAARHYAAVRSALDAKVAAAPFDPWPVVPWGFAGLSLAEIELARGDLAAVRSLLAATLPVLLGVESLATREDWDAAQLASSQQLQARLQAGAAK